MSAGYGDGSLIIYDFKTNEVKAWLRDHLFAINDIAWSPQFSTSNYLATCGDDTLTLIYDLNS